MAGGPVTIRILGDASGFKSAVGQVEGLTDRVSGAFGKIATLAAGVGVTAFFKGAVTAASNMNETVSKVGVIFGSASKDVEQFAATAATGLGQSKQQALDAASTFAIFGKSAGLAGKDLVGFATGMDQLAADLASFHNTSPEEAIQAIGSALRGEAEPIRKYGVLLDEASLKQEAMRQGLIRTTTQALTPQQKVLAAHALILKQTSDAQGDFARTSDGLANQSRTLSARFEDLKAKLGQSLLPYIQQAVSWIGGQLIPAVERAAPVFAAMVDQVAGAARGFVALIGPVAQFLPQLALLGAGSVGAVAGISKVTQAAAGMIKTLSGIAGALSPTTAVLAAFAAVAGGALVNAFVESAKRAVAVKDAQEGLTEALRAGHDPTQMSIDRFGELAKSLKDLKPPTDDAKKAVADTFDAWAEAAAGNIPGLVAELNHFGVSFTDLGKYLKDPTQGIARFGDAARLGSEDTFGFMQKLSILTDAVKKQSQATEADARVNVNAAVAKGVLTQATVAEALASRGATSEGETYLALNERAVKAMEVLRGATVNATKSRIDANDSVAAAVRPTEDATKAEKALTDAQEAAKRSTDDLKAAQDRYLGNIVDVPAAVDRFRDAEDKLRESVAKNGPAFDELTRAGRDNRAALRDVEGAAKDVVQALAAHGATAREQVAGLQNYADEVYDTAIQLGLGAQKAGEMRDAVLSIPTERVVHISVVADPTFDRGQPLGGGLSANAEGGPVVGNVPTLVGEKGPEIFVPDSAGRIIPNDQIGVGGGVALAQQTAPTVVNVTVNGSVLSDRDLAATLRRVFQRGYQVT